MLYFIYFDVSFFHLNNACNIVFTYDFREWNVWWKDIIAINTQPAVRIKTAIGRGGYVKDIFCKFCSLLDGEI